jgi:hypothetical protein
MGLLRLAKDTFLWWGAVGSATAIGAPVPVSVVVNLAGREGVTLRAVHHRILASALETYGCDSEVHLDRLS